MAGGEAPCWTGWGAQLEDRFGDPSSWFMGAEIRAAPQMRPKCWRTCVLVWDSFSQGVLFNVTDLLIRPRPELLSAAPVLTSGNLLTSVCVSVFVQLVRNTKLDVNAELIGCQGQRSAPFQPPCVQKCLQHSGLN
ncbi:hypothetical protein CHARACLAT_012237 [Characodon lateralis]|uniref:Uncharacterized protein n=1 Tax=Characodon lateralis TaxID=208331 RepID=A0ABU7CMK8_9TELE|nr:hypothetical protein [Characodon lateralis]